MLDIFEQMAKDKTVLAVGETLDEKQLLASDTDAMLHDPHIWFDVELWKVLSRQSVRFRKNTLNLKQIFKQMKRLT